MASIGILVTKNGRTTGNGFCYAITGDGECRIETDFGNKISFSEKDVKENFWPQTNKDYPVITYVEWLQVRKGKQDVTNG